MAANTIHVSTKPWPLTRRLLLACGLLYSASYVLANDVIAASLMTGYSRMDQAVSELSATGAAARPFLVATTPVWAALMVGFGVGIAWSAAGSRALRLLGVVTAVHGVYSLLWLWFPMSSRAEMADAGPGTNDTGHLVLSAGTGLFAVLELTLLAIAFGAWAWAYAAASVAVMAGFNVLVASTVNDIAHGAATPWMGLYERIGMAPWLLWPVIVSVLLLRRDRPTRDGSGAGGASLAAAVMVHPACLEGASRPVPGDRRSPGPVAGPRGIAGGHWTPLSTPTLAVVQARPPWSSSSRTHRRRTTSPRPPRGLRSVDL